MIVQGVSPGGVYEAQFGDHNYRVLWKVSHLHKPIKKLKKEEKKLKRKAAN